MINLNYIKILNLADIKNLPYRVFQEMDEKGCVESVTVRKILRDSDGNFIGISDVITLENFSSLEDISKELKAVELAFNLPSLSFKKR
jgi:hypothetical protein